MDKYNLHLLGWKQFEELCTHIMQYVLGWTYTPFSMGKDGGRDGYYNGSGILNDKLLTGKFVSQCKHTTKSNAIFTYKVMSDEYRKINNLVATGGVQHYIIFTNYKLTAENEMDIVSRFEMIPGLNSCMIFGSEWLSSIIDSHKVLRRLVPRLYGIGDLSEILDERIMKQSEAVIEELGEVVSSFVSTKSYREALKAIIEHRFVILIGPPAVGKSAIATNICMSAIAEGESNATLILEHPNQFKDHWNPDDPHKTFWFDDVFGATSIDNSLVKAWATTLPKLSAAIKRGASVIFTSRDYIFNEAKNKLKQTAFPLLFNAQVHVNVNDLDIYEKEQILYNHQALCS